jgi:glucosamine--fructose-6-phosphate aminotransferase (isomerizing)
VDKPFQVAQVLATLVGPPTGRLLSPTHTLVSSDDKFALVHNGVIENYLGIRKFLEGMGYEFFSSTDSETLVNLIAYHYAKEEKGTDRFFESVRKSLLHVEGTYGLGVLCLDEPGEIIGARKGSPLIVGLGDGESLLASDVAAFAHRTQNVVYLNDSEIVRLTADRFSHQHNQPRGRGGSCPAGGLAGRRIYPW